ncbi:52b1eeea-6ba7-41bd-bff8-c20ceff14081 [Thermothielavioides terrestris]|uniref:52b1eeea-6ba7-41bd-bff8-c20ceff14081 n=1 Tax=Thermothielavioides terrestris TaxID=2587410 RepID=A0A446BFH5_9PEZI|nr:52b1eeea-6ba7-41bd-bff8-c20ceff14081 [Thermothielavioides terrestris]
MSPPLQYQDMYFEVASFLEILPEEAPARPPPPPPLSARTPASVYMATLGHHGTQDFSNINNMTYPDPPHYSSAMDLGLSPEPYSAYPRSSHDFPATMGYENGAVYAEAPYMYGSGRASPGMYPDDGDVARGPASDPSIASASSSNMGSPLSSHGQMAAPIPEWAAAPHGLGLTPGIVDQSDYFPGEYSFAPGGIEGFNSPYDFPASKAPGFVAGFWACIPGVGLRCFLYHIESSLNAAYNFVVFVSFLSFFFFFAPGLEQPAYPSLIHPEVRPMAMPYEPSYPAPPNSGYPASPALSVSASPQLRTGSASPFMHNIQLLGEQPYSGDESREKQRCPHPDCGKAFKDLKAHMLTHQTERPEKCPITTCEYHVKGFARKYDKNRHTLTHYKGTMVCGFCPGSGSAAEKSFNRADVFKRHLTAVHGVEQTPPNSRKKTAGAGSTSGNGKLTGYAPDATGKCSTCSQTFSNAQDFYEHLDDCVLRIVQQEDPAEAINAQRLAEVENDRDVHSTLEKNNLPTTTMTTTTEDADEEDENMDDDEPDEDSSKAGRGGKDSLASPTKKTKGNPANGVQKSRGLTHSRGGVPLHTKARGRKNRRDYPSSWGFDKGQMNMKKRVLAVFDGPRRLAKDDMMLSTEQEVRIKLRDGKSYVTDLDLQTLKRAEGFLNATDEEKGLWVSDDPTEEQIKQMLEFSAGSSEAAAAAAAAAR